MKRVIKPEGACHIEIEDVPLPEIRQTEVLIKTERTLISRGSEIWRRYVREEAIDPRIMGYSLAGTIVQVGAQVDEFSMGERVAALAPHAEYVTVEVVHARNKPSVVSLPDAIASEAATFWPLLTSSVLWMRETGAGQNDAMAILGQGLVGSCCLQVARHLHECRTIAVDALSLCCDLAAQLGADAVVNASQTDPVAAVRGLTEGLGADVVVEAVGGRAGAQAFLQAQDMVRRGGLLQVVGLYEDEPLPLNSSKIQGKRLVGGYLDGARRPRGSDLALQLLMEGNIQTEAMVTHRFDFEDAATAFDLLYTRLDEAMAVVLIWKD